MSRAPGQFAPSWLPRQQHRRIDRQLRKLFRHDTCSVCGAPFNLGSCTVSGLDVHGNAVLAGECCIGQVVKIFGVGFISAHQEVADTDKWRDDIVRRGGGSDGFGHPPKVNPHDGPWKEDDRDWFAQNPKRSHRARLPFPGEANKEAAGSPAGHTMIMLVRQVEPGSRLKTNFYLTADALPVPDDEATIHALFEIAAQREPLPPNLQAFFALIEKYRTQEPGHDA
jgi:hypothetical protein